MAEKKKPAKRKSPAKKPASRAKKPAPRKPATRRPAKKTVAKLRWYKRRNFWVKFFYLMMMLFFLMIAGLALIARDLPDISKLDVIEKSPGITITTVDGMILATYGDVYGEFIPYKELPPSVVKAVLATEDRRFFDHPGVDIWGIARAMVRNIQAGGFVQGGSTITQQVAKNVFLTPDRTLYRKVQEALLALWLEGRFSKEEILAIYMNRVYLGAGVYGVDAAAKRYFGKGARELTLVESASLAGLLKAPSRYAPTADFERAKKRTHQVLLNMVDADMLIESEVQPALDSFEPPATYRKDGDDSGKRYFTDWIAERVPLYTGDINEDIIVVTTLDPKMQREAEDAVHAFVEKYGEEKQFDQAALLSMTPGGAVRAMVGGADYRESQYNRATQAKRQPGSVFKIFAYLAALEAGAKPTSLVVDEPVEIEVNGKKWRPTNFGGEYRGEIELQEALKHSVNTIAVKLGDAVGFQNVANLARRFGIVDLPVHPSMVLGSVEVTPLEMTTAYAHLANRGQRVEPYGILKITTQSGEEVYKHSQIGNWQVVSNNVVNMMNHMLTQVPNGGTGGRANIGRPVAGKTGTSQNYRDAWFIGFTPQYVTSVWVGNDNNGPTKGITGGNIPAMIWGDFMRKALAGKAAPAIPTSDEREDDILPWLQENSGDSVLKRIFGGRRTIERGNEDAERRYPSVRDNRIR